MPLRHGSRARIDSLGSVNRATNPESTEDANALDPIWAWVGDVWSTVWEYLADVALTIAVIVVLWLVARMLISALTRGVERGADLTERQARKLARKGKTPPPVEYVQDLRLETERRYRRARTIRAVLNSTVTVAAITIAVLVLLADAGVPVTALVASAGILSVALGFGAQSLVKDLISGVFMLLEDQYGVGDVIDVGDAVGTVEEVGLRSVRLRALDGTVWYVPNGEIRRVGNMTRTWSRALIEVRFAYDTNLDDARQAMFDAVDEAKKKPAIADAMLERPTIPGIEALAYNSVTLRLVMKVNPAAQWEVQREVRRHMRRIFAERGIELGGPEAVATIGLHEKGVKIDQPKRGAKKAAPNPEPESNEVLPPESDDE